MRFGNLRIRTKIIVGSLVPLSLIVLLYFAAHESMRALLESVRLVDRTHMVLEQSIATEKSAVDMEAGLRAFQLTGKEEYLEPYKTGLKTVQDLFGQLKKAVKDNPAQLKLLEQCRQTLSLWQWNVADPAIDLRREIGEGRDMNHMAKLVAQAGGQEFLHKFRGLNKTFIDREYVKLIKRQEILPTENDPIRLRESYKEMEASHAIIDQGREVFSAALDMESGARAFMLVGADEFLASYATSETRLFATIEQLAKAVKQSPDQLALLGQMETLLEEWNEKILKPQIKLRREISDSKTMVDQNEVIAKGEGKKYFDRFRGTMDRFMSNERTLLEKRRQAAARTQRTAEKVLLGGTILTIILAVVISYLLSGIITRPLAQAARLAETISTGDLTKRLEVDKSDEIGRLYTALNAMADSLRNQISLTLDGINILSSSSAEISATVAQLSVGTSKTTSALTEVTTTIEEVKQAARLVRDQAKSVATRAGETVGVTESGKKATEDTVARMHLIRDQMESIGETVVRLSEHSRTIEDIIGSVKDLADQSNLLAVNASIEAAKAGEQGKGFVVVAQEIKALADQSRQATDRIRTILDDTGKWVSAVVMATEQGGKAVEAGLHQSVLAGQSIQALAAGVAESAQAASVIDTSSSQQAVGVEEVAVALTSIEESMRQNLEGMSQLESSAQRLHDLGAQLKELVQKYTV